MAPVGKLVQLPTPTDGGMTERNDYVLREPLSVRLGRINRADLIQLVNSRPARIDLLDYLFENSDILLSALRDGATRKELHAMLCGGQVKINAPFSYGHFCRKLATMLWIVGIYPKQDKIDILASQLHEMAVVDGVGMVKPPPARSRPPAHQSKDAAASEVGTVPPSTPAGLPEAYLALRPRPAPDAESNLDHRLHR